MKHIVELAESAGLNLPEQITRLDIVGKLQRLQVSTPARVDGEIRDDDVRATAPVELPHQRAADKTCAASDQDTVLPPNILFFDRPDTLLRFYANLAFLSSHRCEETSARKQSWHGCTEESE